MSFDNATWLQVTSPLQQCLPAMLCKVYTKHSAPQQDQCIQQGICPSSYQSGQGTQPLRVAVARYQGYFPSQSPTPSGGVSRHLNHVSLRQSPCRGTPTNLSCTPLQHAGRESQRHTCQDSLNLSQFHHFCTATAAVLRQVSG